MPQEEWKYKEGDPFIRIAKEEDSMQDMIQFTEDKFIPV